MLSARIATPRQCKSLYRSLFHVLQAQSTQICSSQDTAVAVPHIQRLIPKGRGFNKQPYNESPKLQSSCHKFCVVMVVSVGLMIRSTLMWSKFQKNFWGTMPPDTLTTLCVICACHMAAPNSLYVCSPTSSMSRSIPEVGLILFASTGE